MALIKTTVSDFATFNNAYIKIDSIVWRDDITGIAVTVKTYVDQVARLADFMPVVQNIYTINIPIDGITIAKVYNELKLLDEFATATDDL